MTNRMRNKHYIGQSWNQGSGWKQKNSGKSQRGYTGYGGVPGVLQQACMPWEFLLEMGLCFHLEVLKPSRNPGIMYSHGYGGFWFCFRNMLFSVFIMQEEISRVHLIKQCFWRDKLYCCFCPWKRKNLSQFSQSTWLQTKQAFYFLEDVISWGYAKSLAHSYT